MTDLPGFGKRMIMECFHVRGKLVVWRIQLYRYGRNIIAFLESCLRIWEVRRSCPGDFRGFRLLIRNLTSEGLTAIGGKERGIEEEKIF